MQLSKRENQLIDLFIENGMTLTAGQLADFANVSTKTVYRTVKKINEATDAGDIIISEIGKGLSLDYERYLKASVQYRVNDKSTESLDRRKNILLTLLFRAPNKVLIADLFAGYYISDPVISKDISKLSEYLNHHKLTLLRKNKRLSVKGMERHIRRAVNELIRENNLMEDSFTTEAQKISSYDIDFITSMLEVIEKKLETVIVHPYNVNIFSHLYILVKRSREGEIRADNEGEPLNQEEEQLIAEHTELFQLSRYVIAKMSSYLGRQLPDVEAFYLFQYLMSSRMETTAPKLAGKSKEAWLITIFFAEEMSKALGIDINKPVNQEDLLGHIAPLLYRLKNEIVVKNDLLKDIQLEYKEIFQQVKIVSRKAEDTFMLHSISDDEIGFLTLYFVRYKEMQQRKRRILIMCSSGVGTSELLKVKVRKAFPDLEIVDVLSSKKFVKYIEEYSDIDLILTTVHLTKKPNIPTILVNSMFTRQDETRVKEMLGGIEK